MGNQPIYRYPPRSHAHNCQCDRCVQCRNRPERAGIIGFDLGCLAVCAVFAAGVGVVGLIGKLAELTAGAWLMTAAVVAAVAVTGIIVWTGRARKGGPR